MRHGVSDRRRSRTSRDLADAERDLVLRIDQLNFDLWHVAELQHRVGFPIKRPNAVVETNLLLKHPARGLENAAFKLVDHTIWVDHQAGIGRAPDMVQSDVFVDRQLDDYRGVGGAVL